MYKEPTESCRIAPRSGKYRKSMLHSSGECLPFLCSAMLTTLEGSWRTVLCTSPDKDCSSTFGRTTSRGHQTLRILNHLLVRGRNAVEIHAPCLVLLWPSHQSQEFDRLPRKPVQTSAHFDKLLRKAAAILGIAPSCPFSARFELNGMPSVRRREGTSASTVGLRPKDIISSETSIRRNASDSRCIRWLDIFGVGHVPNNSENSTSRLRLLPRVPRLHICDVAHAQTLLDLVELVMQGGHHKMTSGNLTRIARPAKANQN
mmetsp:Transcript_38929/g.103474  ORF Transcript_38929/g.103474 Transcript_38929/m.103474 type:complete len:260 (+) Transcript_38929:108-887(+)